MKDIYRWAFVFSLIILHVGLGASSALKKSPTADEYSYISTGYLYTATWDFRLDRTHPPLIRLLTGLPLHFLYIEMPPLRLDLWDTPKSYELGYIMGWEMLLGGANDWRMILFVSRIPILLLSAILAFLIYRWSRELYGDAGGLFSLALYCFSPNILAHARLATLDLGISFFYLATVYALYRYLKIRIRHNLVIVGIVLGLALMVKVTAILLVPIVIVALMFAAVPPGDSFRKINIAYYLQSLCLVFACAVIVLLLVYGFPFKPCYYFDTLANVFQKSLASGKGGEAVAGMPHRNTAFFLMGHYSTDGWPYYYLVALAVKTPLAVFAMFALYWIAGPKRRFDFSDGLILGSIAVLLIASAFNRVNIGIRHILPIYPLLFLYAGRIVLLKNKRIYQAVLVLLMVWFLISSLSIYPDYLAYFNELAGGPDQGQTILDDSNIDWGQDLGRLKDVQNQYPDTPLFIATNWIVNPAAFDIEATFLKDDQIANPPKGIVAVGKHWAIRHRVFRRSPYYFDWFEKYEPFGNIGHSILLYRFD